MSFANFYFGRGEIQRTDPLTLDEGLFEYRTFLPAQLRGTSTCRGTAPGPGITCAESNLRSTITGDLPYLYNRSFLSSGGPVTAVELDFADTLGLPVVLTPEQQYQL